MSATNIARIAAIAPMMTVSCQQVDGNALSNENNIEVTTTTQGEVTASSTTIEDAWTAETEPSEALCEEFCGSMFEEVVDEISARMPLGHRIKLRYEDPSEISVPLRGVAEASPGLVITILGGVIRDIEWRPDPFG